MPFLAKNSKINQLIDESWLLFEPYALCTPIEHTWYQNEAMLTGGNSDEEFLEDLAKPLREVAELSIAGIACEGYMLKRLDDYKHFLPRILEQIVLGQYPDPVFRTIKEQQFDLWPAREQKLTIDLAREVFELVLDGEHYFADCFLEGERQDSATLDYLDAVCYLLPLNDLLDRWHEREDDSATRILVRSALLAASYIENIVSSRDCLALLDETDFEISEEELEKKLQNDSQFRVTKFLLYSTKVQQILRDRSRSKALGLVDTVVDIDRLKKARSRMKEFGAFRKVACREEKLWVF